MTNHDQPTPQPVPVPHRVLLASWHATRASWHARVRALAARAWARTWVGATLAPDPVAAHAARVHRMRRAARERHLRARGIDQF